MEDKGGFLRGSKHMRRVVGREEINGMPHLVLECDHRKISYVGASPAQASKRVHCPECAEAEGPSGAGPPRRGRECAFPGCGTKLNSHNKGRLCCLHRAGSLKRGAIP